MAAAAVVLPTPPLPPKKIYLVSGIDFMREELEILDAGRALVVRLTRYFPSPGPQLSSSPPASTTNDEESAVWT